MHEKDKFIYPLIPLNMNYDIFIIKIHKIYFFNNLLAIFGPSMQKCKSLPMYNS